MRPLILAIAATLLATGCESGPKSCDNYVSAYNTCVELLSPDSFTLDADATGCDQADDANADYYDCLTDAYSNGDCSTDEGWVETVAAAAVCAFPTDTE
jgi:hypothetical protein